MAETKIVANGGVSNSRTAIEPFGEISEPTSEEVADYIADMLRELRDLAKSTGLAALSALLELAEREADRAPVTIGRSNRPAAK